MRSLRDRACECGYRRCPRRWGMRCLKCERVEELRRVKRLERQQERWGSPRPLEIKVKEASR